MSSLDPRISLPEPPETRCPLGYFFGRQKWEGYLTETGRRLCGSSPDLPAAIAKLGKLIAAGVSGPARAVIGEQWQTGEPAAEEKLACRADFHYAFVLPAAFGEKQARRVERVLEQIQDKRREGQPSEARTLNRVRAAFARYAQGLTERAFEVLREAEKEDEANFVLELYLGFIRLYAVDDYVNLLDLAEAEKHFLGAARFARIQHARLPQWRQYAAEAYLHAAICCMAQASDAADPANRVQSHGLLARALDCSRQAEELDPELAEAAFHSARINALLGQDGPALEALERAIAADANYALKADADPAFLCLRPGLDRLFASLRSDAEMRFARARAVLPEIELSGRVPLSKPIAGDYRAAVERLQAHAAPQYHTYLGLLAGVRLLEAIGGQLDQWISQGLVGEPGPARARAVAVIARIRELSQIATTLGLAPLEPARQAVLEEKLRDPSAYYADIFSEAEAEKRETLAIIEEHFRDLHMHAVERLEATHEEWVQAQANAEQCHGLLGGGGFIAILVGAAGGLILGYFLGPMMLLGEIGVAIAFCYSLWRDGFIGKWRWLRTAAAREMLVKSLERQVDTYQAMLNKCAENSISSADAADLRKTLGPS